MASNSKWSNMRDIINKSIREIREANSDYKAPTLVGELRDRVQTIIIDKGPQAGQVRRYGETKKYLQNTIGKALGKEIKYSLKSYHETLKNLYEEQQKSFKNVQQYENTEIDKIKNSLVNDLSAEIEIKDVNGRIIRLQGKQLWDYLDRFTLQELKDIFAEAVSKTDKTDGKMNYATFAENLSEVIATHLQ